MPFDRLKERRSWDSFGKLRYVVVRGPIVRSDLAFLSISAAGDLFRRHALSPVELTQALLDRIAALDGRLHAFVTVTAEQAMADAWQAEAELQQGRDRGPLHGIPVGLKDNFATAGTPTTAGSRLLAGWMPDQDAAVVTRLRAAGAVILGKLTMHELGCGAPGPNDPFPAARNPWNIKHLPGGSSSGSGAAVAAGLCLGALGSDTGGSVRTPASCCGVTGLKPTFGRVSLAGTVPLAHTLDHAGPLARSVLDCALLLQTIAGHDPSDPRTSAAPTPDFRVSLRPYLTGLRVGVCRNALRDEGVEAAIVQAVQEALDVLRALGAVVVEVNLPHLAEAHAAATAVLLAEAYVYHQAALHTQSWEFGEQARQQLLRGAGLGQQEYLRAQRIRSMLQEELGAVLGRVDAVVLPTTPTTAPAANLAAGTGHDESPRYSPSFTSPFNLVGLPALSIPCGFDGSNLPIGLQVVGRWLDDATVLRVGHAYQEATDWHLRRPPLGREWLSDDDGI